jgi:hypothetical protein
VSSFCIVAVTVAPAGTVTLVRSNARFAARIRKLTFEDCGARVGGANVGAAPPLAGAVAVGCTASGVAWLVAVAIAVAVGWAVGVLSACTVSLGPGRVASGCRVGSASLAPPQPDTIADPSKSRPTA